MPYNFFMQNALSRFLIRRVDLADEIFGGLSAMLVALPSAIAFGLVVYAPLGGGLSTRGALAGILGTIAIGSVAALFGGAPRLISAPCAPAAAVLAALTAELARRIAAGTLPAEWAVPILLLTALLCGLFQFLFGLLGGGKLIKFIPYPVVAGYLSGVGLLIISAQLPKLLGVSQGFVPALRSPGDWQGVSIAVGGVSAALMMAGPTLARHGLRGIPAPVLALGGALVTYFGIATFLRPELASLAGNSLVIGQIEGAQGDPGALWIAIGHSLQSLGMSFRFLAPENWTATFLPLVLVPAATLAVLLSVDTLKTCVIVDALTQSRHDSDRELRAQGLANLASAVVGGMPGAGTMGATLVNLTSGGRTRGSSLLCAVFALATLLLFGRLVAWVPHAALAGILLVVGFRMVDRKTLTLLGHRSTVLDFGVVAAVIVTALAVNLIAAAGVGFGLAVLLFLRDHIRGAVVRRRLFGHQVFSKKHRLPIELAALERFGAETVVFELQGSLFFGTTDQLLNEVEPCLATCRTLILDMKRATSVDFSAVHLLEQIEARVAAKGGHLLFADLPQSLPSGQDLRTYFKELGLDHASSSVQVFAELDAALEWSEEQLLARAGFREPGAQGEAPLALGEVDLLQGLAPAALELLREVARERRVAAGDRIFSQGDAGAEIFLIRRGAVRVMLPLSGGKSHHLATFARGDFFGDMSFLDQGARSADALAATDTELFVIGRQDFDRVSASHPELGSQFFARLSSVLAVRLRQADTELRALEES